MIMSVKSAISGARNTLKDFQSRAKSMLETFKDHYYIDSDLSSFQYTVTGIQKNLNAIQNMIQEEGKNRESSFDKQQTAKTRQAESEARQQMRLQKQLAREEAQRAYEARVAERMRREEERRRIAEEKRTKIQADFKEQENIAASVREKQKQFDEEIHAAELNLIAAIQAETSFERKLKMTERQEENARLAEMNGRSVTEIFNKEFDAVADPFLKEFAYRVAIKNENVGKSFDVLLVLAQKEYDEYKNDIAVIARQEDVYQTLRKSKRASEKALKILTDKKSKSDKQQDMLIDLAANTEIDEKVRINVLEKIKGTLRSLGFYIDDAQSVALIGDEVVLLAQKPQGETVECRSSIDGRLDYRFENYVGTDCDKDANNFVGLLEEVYGLALKQEEFIRLDGNPDRVSTSYNTASDKIKSK